MTLLPSAPDTGIVFKRTDIAGGGGTIAATWDNVVDTRLCTTLGNADGIRIATVEHLLSALSGAGVDNLVIEVNGPEVPVMDGSAAPFLFLFECAGVVEQDQPRRYIRVLKPVSIDDGLTSATLLPGEGSTFDFEINFDSAAVARQTISVDLADDFFKKEISRAHTFGFLHEVEQLREAGLVKGGSLDNAVVVSGDKVINEDGLRYVDEFVRHKVLDAVGDLFLAGGSVIGHFAGVCSGHAANNKLLRALFADKDAWCYAEMETGTASSAANGPVWNVELAEDAIAATA